MASEFFIYPKRAKRVRWSRSRAFVKHFYGCYCMQLKLFQRCRFRVPSSKLLPSAMAGADLPYLSSNQRQLCMPWIFDFHQSKANCAANGANFVPFKTRLKTEEHVRYWFLCTSCRSLFSLPAISWHRPSQSQNLESFFHLGSFLDSTILLDRAM